MKCTGIEYKYPDMIKFGIFEIKAGMSENYYLHGMETYTMLEWVFDS